MEGHKVGKPATQRHAFALWFQPSCDATGYRGEDGLLVRRDAAAPL